jgi:predicted alpha/beta-hydrolase family hydrolase
VNAPQAGRIQLPNGGEISSLTIVPADAIACYVFAHGAGAGMEHSFMGAFAAGLASRSIATLRYQFPFMEKGSRRPDSPPVAHATIRAAVAEAVRQMPGLPLLAGGKSFGGRMTSQAQVQTPLPGVVGLAFVGFPLHPAGKPSTQRAEHLSAVDVPMLFLQGTRDTLGEFELIHDVTSRLGQRTKLVVIDGADHALHVLARSGRTDAQAMDEMLDAFAAWTGTAVRTPLWQFQPT